MILDTFVSMFTADTSDFEKGQDKARKSTDEIVKSMKEAEKQAQTTNEKMATFAKGALGFLATAVSFAQMAGTSIEQAGVIEAMDQTAQSIGLAVGELDAFNKTMKDSGATAQASEDSLLQLYKNVGVAASDANSSQAKTFADLGVSLKDSKGNAKDVISLMTELADKSNSIGAENALEGLGLTDQKVLQAIKKGSLALEEQMKRHKDLGVITKEQVEVSKAYKKASNMLSNSLENGARTMMTMLLPAITWITKALSKVVDWMNENKFFVTGFFTAIALIVSTLYLPAMLAAAAATLVAIAPILGIAAAIGLAAAAIALIYDDIMNFIDGNDSLIGQFLNDYPIIGEVIDSIVDAFKLLNEAFWETLSAAQEIGQGMMDAFGAVGDFILDVFMGIKDIIMSVFEWVMSKIDAISNTGKKIASWFGFGDDKDSDTKDESKSNDKDKSKYESKHENKDSGTKDESKHENKDSGTRYESKSNDKDTKNIQEFNKTITNTQDGVNQAGNYLKSASTSPLNSQTSNSIQNSASSRNTENSVTIGELKIETQATDSKGISNNVRNDLSEQLKNLNAESSTGIAK